MKNALPALIVGGVISTSAPTGPPPAGSEGDQGTKLPEVQVFTLRSQHDSAALAGVAESLLKHYAEDAVLMPPGELPVEGKDAIRSWLTPARCRSVGSSDSVSIRVEGTLAVVVTTGGPASGNPRPASGIWLLRRAGDGEWKITHNMWN